MSRTDGLRLAKGEKRSAEWAGSELRKPSAMLEALDCMGGLLNDGGICRGQNCVKECALC